MLPCAVSQPCGKCCVSMKVLEEFIMNCMAKAGSWGPLLESLREVSVEMLALINVVTFPPQVKMWVQLLIPRIEDGNNFGVSIQVRHHWLCALPQERAVLQGCGSLGFL